MVVAIRSHMPKRQRIRSKRTLPASGTKDPELVRNGKGVRKKDGKAREVGIGSEGVKEGKKEWN